MLMKTVIASLIIQALYAIYAITAQGNVGAIVDITPETRGVVVIDDLTGMRVLDVQVAGGHPASIVPLGKPARVHLPGVFVLLSVLPPSETAGQLLVP